MTDISQYDAEVENYGQFLDLKRPKSIRDYKILCHCPKCGKTHIRTYSNLLHAKDYIYCRKHRTAILYEQKYGPGITCNMLRPDVQAKAQATKKARYGEDYGQKWYEAQKERMLEKFGVENAGLAADQSLKAFNSMVERYGSTEKAYAIRQKHIEQTAEEEYGSYENYTKIRLESQLESLRTQYNDNSITSIKNIPHLKEERFNKYLNELQYFPKVNVTFKNGFYNFKCAVCGYETPVTYENRIYHCPNCNKFVKPKGQIGAINAFINRTLNEETQLDYKDIFSGLSFDIYIPSKNIGIDLISTAVHSNIGSNFLQNKSQDSEKFGISALFIMEDYWYTKPEIVKSKIALAVGKYEKQCDGLRSTVMEIEKEVYEAFCMDNHLWGVAQASLKLGMFCDDELVAVAGFSIPRYLKEYNWEILRFCNKNGYQIDNSLRAFIIWMTQNKPNDSIVYYHDMRWPDDTENAMEYLRDTVPSIYYWKDDGKLESWSLNKRTWLEHKDGFDYNGELSTRANLLKEGYNIMYDCGYKVYIYY